jgi:hypothetical protein
VASTPDCLEFLKIAALLVRHIQVEREREPVAAPGFSLDVPFGQSQLRFHFMQSCSCNAYEINEFVKKGPSMMNAASVELGGAVYPTIRYVK